MVRFTVIKVVAGVGGCIGRRLMAGVTEVRAMKVGLKCSFSHAIVLINTRVSERWFRNGYYYWYCCGKCDGLLHW